MSFVCLLSLSSWGIVLCGDGFGDNYDPLFSQVGSGYVLLSGTLLLGSGGFCVLHRWGDDSLGDFLCFERLALMRTLIWIGVVVSVQSLA